MPPLAIQVGDWANRLRRALGLRGDLGYQLGTPIATPFVQVFDVTKEPYASEPILWSISAYQAAAGAGTYPTLTADLPSTGGIGVLDGASILLTSGAFSSWAFQLERPKAYSLTGAAYDTYAGKTNPDAQDTAVPGFPIAAPVFGGIGYGAQTAYTGWLATQSTLGDSSRLIKPIVFRPGDQVVVQAFQSNVAVWGTLWGRWYPDRS